MSTVLTCYYVTLYAEGMQEPNQQPREKAPMPARPAGARLLDYLGTGAGVALLPGGLALVVMADHLVEVVRLTELAVAARA
jgi:hypothetical protein